MNKYNEIPELAQRLAELDSRREGLTQQIGTVDAEMTDLRTAIAAALGVSASPSPKRTTAGRHTGTRAAILNLLKSRPVVTSLDVAEATGVQRTLASVALCNLFTDGRLVRVAPGTYRAAADNGASPH